LAKQVWCGAESLHDDGQGFSAGIIKVCGGTVTPADRASYALYTFTPWIGLSGGGNKLFRTPYWQYFGNPLAVGATAPTTTVSGADALWHNKAVTLTFSALDNKGGSGVAYAQYRLDADPWTKATMLTIAAPVSYADDGSHMVGYRFAGEAGKLEAAHICTVHIDTRRPKLVANWAAAVKQGHTIALLCERSAIGLADGHCDHQGQDADRAPRDGLTASGAAVDRRLTARFVCRLVKGRCRFYVDVTDAAGNTQSKVASNRLTVR
jgi:hypothetical protein